MRDFMMGVVDRAQDDVLVRSQPGRLVEIRLASQANAAPRLSLAVDQCEALLALLPEAIHNARGTEAALRERQGDGS